jgi:integrase
VGSNPTGPAICLSSKSKRCFNERSIYFSHLGNHLFLVYEGFPSSYRGHLQEAGIAWGATCHTLRHTCATWQLDKGIPLEVVRENLGHEDIATTQIYLHLNIRQRSRTYRNAVRFGLRRRNYIGSDEFWLRWSFIYPFPSLQCTNDG